MLRGVGGEGGLELRDARAKRVALRVHGADERVVFVLLLELLELLELMELLFVLRKEIFFFLFHENRHCLILQLMLLQ